MTERAFRVGDRVRRKGGNTTGRVRSIWSDSVMVEWVMTRGMIPCDPAELELVTPAEEPTDE